MGALPMNMIPHNAVAEKYDITEFISPAIFTQITSISRHRMNRLIRDGYIEAKRMPDGRLLLSVASVNSWIESLDDAQDTFTPDAPQECSVEDAMSSFNERRNGAIAKDLFA
jgi:hypothetical protein